MTAEHLTDMLWRFLLLIAIDLLVAFVALLVIFFLAVRKRAAFAVLKRNFLGYFANPTGYVFLCLFVLLTSMAAFWPYEFFSSNLANLDQLNFWFPIIMLFFIPAITMSIWAEEKRQGTDELLLTLPADDFDIVIGKYLAAASIYTVSLVFSQFSTFLVLLFLSNGSVDTGLFFANYLGYWFIGLAMLSIGMIASFITSNLTVGFILGAAFNAPLAFASMSDVIIPYRKWSQLVSSFSISEQFDNFGRGVISTAPIAFFLLVLSFGLYFCMVLIGRRHWSGGKNGNTMFLHYFGRILMMLVIVFGLSYFLKYNDWPRRDATEGQVSSLSPVTRQLIKKLEPERPIVVDAYISSNIPEQYAKTRYDLITLLKEFEALASSRKVKLQVQIYDDLETSGEEAQRALKQYGIEPQVVRVRERGAFKDQEVLLGAAVRSGLSKVVIPFFESGVPVEYELVRSINTVSKPKRVTLGIINTDANFMGGFSMAGGGFSQIPKQPIVLELEKQYDVEAVDPSTPISVEQYDVLFAVQPSSLNPQQLNNFVDAVRAGVPTAIFEDPFPAVYQGIPGTGEPKQAAGGMMGMGQPPEPKGDIQQLWNALSLDVPVAFATGSREINPDVVWQQYNPHDKLRYMMNSTDEWLFITDSAAEEGDYLSEESSVTAGLRELMFLYAGCVNPAPQSDGVTIQEIVKTRENSGTISYENVRNQGVDASSAQLRVLQGAAKGPQTIAVYIEGKSSDVASTSEEKAADGSAEDADKPEESSTPASRPIKAVYVADVDCMHPFFSENRKKPEQFADLDLRVQNITFVLNIVDVLVGEKDYPAIRSHEPQHISLKLFEDQAEKFRQAQAEDQKKYQEDFNNAIREAEDEIQTSMLKFQEKVERLQREGPTDPSKQAELIAAVQQLQMQRAALERKFAIRREKMEGKRDDNIKESQREAETQVLKLQNFYKTLAVVLPPIPPLLVGIGVFVSRRVREREGISKSRLR
jgi:ABC-2 type transport system permease protein